MIGKFPLAGTGPKRFEKFGLGDLLPYRGSTVEELIKQSVSEQLNEFASFNDVGQVKDALVRSGIAKATLDAQEFGSLAAMITRRHNIVHKADRNDQVGGQGNHPTKSIEVSHLDKYLIAVKSIRDLVAAELI